VLQRMFANSLVAIGLLALAATAAAAKSADYHVLARYALGGQDSGYDYLRLDPGSRRLFIAHGNRVEVINADSGSKVGEISGTQGVHGIAFAPEFGHGFTSNGLARSVTMFDLKTLRPLAEIKYMGVKPDSIEYNPDTHQVFVVNGGETGDVSVISADTGAIVGTVTLGGGKLEAMQFDDQGRGFVNDEDKNVVHVFDAHRLVQTATWSIAPGNGPTGLAIDKQHHRLFAACGNETLVVLDSETGKVVASPTIGADPDGAAFDPKTQRVFVSNRDGTLSIIDASTADRYTVQTVQTAEYARTIALDDRNGRAYLPTAKFNPAPAPSKANPKPRPVMVPESFVVLVVGE
jgi:DNA-binding beta-propeller fold protein YncE